MLRLPDEIILSTLDWIQDDQSTRKCFARMNKLLACNLLRKVVRIEISLGELMKLSEQRRLNLLKRSDNLYLYDILPTPLSIDIKRAYSIQSKRVELLSQLESVHTIKVYQGNETELTAILHLLSDKTRLKLLIVKELYLVEGEGELEEINVIEGLEVLRIHDFSRLKVEGLHLHAYTSLKTVEIENCESIVDVSGLDGIYDLTLRRCHNIKDISCLNHNYRITIADCNWICDLSKSLRESCCIMLEDLQLESLPVFPSVKSLSLHSLRLQNPLTTLALSKSLIFLSLIDTEGIESFGPNNLQKVSIRYCKNFKSLENMANIRTIELVSLNLTSLSGLGANNKIVRLKEMKSLEDISALKDCVNVWILNCGKKLLEAYNNLEHVKELTLALIFAKPFETLFLSHLHTPNLQVLELQLPFDAAQSTSTLLDNIRRLTELYPTVSTFSIDLFGLSVIPNNYLREMFVIDCSRRRHIVLFRK